MAVRARLLVLAGLSAGLLSTASSAAAASLNAPVFRTSDAEGVAVNRVAVQVRRVGQSLDVYAFAVGRSLSAETRPLRLSFAACDRAGRRCVARVRWWMNVRDGETQIRRHRQIKALEKGGPVLVTLGGSSLRMVLPPAAWSRRTPSWYGLKTPEALWGTRTFRSVEFTGKPAGNRSLDVTMNAKLDMPSRTPQTTRTPNPITATVGLVSALLGTLDPTGNWPKMPAANSQVEPSEGFTMVTGHSVAKAPYRRGGFGAFASNGTEPLMILWMPPAQG